ncbi:energy coupling factor transporter S component ThiW [Vagococcus lutrae]|uniref:energy coupling factor transporter S component ThiW n=1 Tax=Vagococcus lutrae TaxID=81947 RepID=UPI00288DFD32|nr:energy coupling factor transporter S component ThiW [Vagococcus lutrae]MDT2823730.1 energy coupling factor transporter S component ThiW [Vagococcus lutrae]
MSPLNYRANLISATLGEIVGTSLLGGTTSFFLAKWLLGLNMPFGLLVLSFAASTAVGALAGFALLKMVWSRLEPFFQKIS